jgi:hypothetical protein
MIVARARCDSHARCDLLAYRFRQPRADLPGRERSHAAYNESKVIANTLRALLTTDYKAELGDRGR